MIEFNWINNCITFVRIFVFSKWSRKKIKPDPNATSVFILANGPSLNKELEFLPSDYFSKKNALVVNYFVFSDLYQKIKPKFYVLSAPDFFFDEPANDIRENVDKLFNGLQEKTNWEMTLFVPYLAKKKLKWQARITNTKIKIHFYNTAVAEGSYGMIKFMLNSQLGMPRVQNVLIPSLAFMIQKGYKKIYLFGVDHSWLKQIHVTNQNDVLMSHPHFYETKVETLKVKKSQDESRSLHEVLHKFYYTFKSYFALKKYAHDKGAVIYNLTDGSYIDAFERMELKKLQENES